MTNVLKEADKGGAVVIMDCVHYEQMIYKQLEDKNTYKKVDPSCNNKSMRTNNALIKKYEKSFLKQEIDYLTNFQHGSSNFYGLPRIHKSKIISKAIEEQGSEYISCSQPKDLKLRPILAGHKCSTKHLSNFVDILLKPLLYKIKNSVKDDFDILKKCKRNLTKNSKLISFDVTSLYTNIPHELGLKAIEYWLDKYPELIHSRFNKSFILEALKLALKNNHFVFNEEFFHQIARTAMGAIVAPYMQH